MRVTRVTENSFKLTKFGIVNCYLVRESGSLTLVDAALKSCAGDIARIAGEIGLPITRILLTHPHQDHIGAVDQLVARSPSIEVVTCERSLPLLRRPPDKALRPDAELGPGQDRIKGPFPGMATEPTHIVAEGDRCGSLRVIDTSGHTPGHLAFLDERDGTLFAGDALIAMSRLAVCTHSPWYFPQKKFVWSAPVAISSARRLLGYPIERFACGHGKVRDGGHPELRKALRLAG